MAATQGRYDSAPHFIMVCGDPIRVNTTTCGREEWIFMNTTTTTSTTGTQGNGAGLGLIGTGDLVKNYIGGKWVEAAGGATFSSNNPATGETLATLAKG